MDEVSEGALRVNAALRLHWNSLPKLVADEVGQWNIEEYGSLLQHAERVFELMFEMMDNDSPEHLEALGLFVEENLNDSNTQALDLFLSHPKFEMIWAGMWDTTHNLPEFSRVAAAFLQGRK
jgi:hypothetical protein